MHPIVNHLIQLQELTLIRDEQRISVGGTAHLENLNASVSAMTQELQGNHRDLFEKLHRKNHIVIVPIFDGICAGCGMKLPISLVQAVRVGRDIHCCPNCTRMLYYPEEAPKRTGSLSRRTEPPKVGISRFSSQSLMIPRLDSEKKEEAIAEMALKMEQEGFVDKANKLVEAALRREAILSTAVDHGLAFPHIRGVEGGGLTLVLGISKKGIKWDDGTKQLSHIIFFIVIPTAASAFYLKLLAGLTEVFMAGEARKALMAEKEAEKLWKMLTRVTRATIK